MEIKHDQQTGIIELILNDDDLEKFAGRADVRADHPDTHEQVVVYIRNKIYDNIREIREHSLPNASFFPNGLLNINLPVGPGENIDLPLHIPHRNIEQDNFTETAFGKLSRIVLRE